MSRHQAASWIPHPRTGGRAGVFGGRYATTRGPSIVRRRSPGSSLGPSIVRVSGEVDVSRRATRADSWWASRQRDHRAGQGRGPPRGTHRRFDSNGATRPSGRRAEGRPSHPTRILSTPDRRLNQLVFTAARAPWLSGPASCGVVPAHSADGAGGVPPLPALRDPARAGRFERIDGPRTLGLRAPRAVARPCCRSCCRRRPSRTPGRLRCPARLRPGTDARRTRPSRPSGWRSA